MSIEISFLSTIPYQKSFSNMDSNNNINESSSFEFERLFSSMILENNLADNSDMMSLVLLLFSKLFGSDLLNLATNSQESSPNGSPVTSGVITQGSHTGHTAVDFGVPIGTSVNSTMSGKVIYAGWNNEGYGNLVIVQSGEYKTYYGHLSEIPVKMGQMVTNGQMIGKSGNTGNSTGPHLHYEVRKNNVQIDPFISI